MRSPCSGESAYQADALSAAPGGGAAGLTQLMPQTARELGVQDRFDPTENVFGGAQYLAAQLRRFGDVRLALAAYNAGPSRVARLGRAPDFPETRDYVVKVVDCYLALTAGRTIRSARDCRTGEPAP
ncbi:MAG: lytic transglycosylase domain-containing protein [Pseudomonadota bacterium]|uniref:lytic transglycosylase domain-containing protein n=1 Tax=Phenylobacterium sp. TaxID=1871053 RepID=UPI0027E896FF|nr:lytic transglycosylase domain-containing protein [Phenylobacterium sp.]